MLLTDVTGFGLLGHLRGMAAASGVSAQVWTDLVPILTGGRGLRSEGDCPGRHPCQSAVPLELGRLRPDITDDEQLLLCDAQTSGGLLASLGGDRAAHVVRELRLAGAGSAALIGSIEAGAPGRIRVRRAPESGMLAN